MCESGWCENTCSPEIAAKCLLLSILDKINKQREGTSRQVVTTIMLDKPNTMTMWKSDWNAASRFFQSWWTRTNR